MTAFRKIVSAKGEYLYIEIPEEFKGKDVEVIILPLETSSASKPTVKNYDFSNLAGKLEWHGDAVAAQRSLRDEW